MPLVRVVVNTNSDVQVAILVEHGRRAHVPQQVTWNFLLISTQVKCDERLDGCGNCEKLHLDCSYSRPGPARSHTSGRRTYRSCNSCRVARCKCSGDRPCCARCRENNIHCSYEDAAKRGSASMPQTAERDVMQVTPDRSSEGGSSIRQASLPAPMGRQSDAQLPWYLTMVTPSRNIPR